MTVPRYIQIAENLLERIATGELVPGERLPSERELSKTLNVSRMTLRAALRELDNKGLLARRTGDGTYVAQPKIERQAGKLVPFTEGMRLRGYQTGAKIIAFEEQGAKESAASQLKIPVSAPIYYIQRLRFIKQEPVMLEKFVVPVYYFPKLNTYDLELRSFYEIAETEYGITIHQAQQSLEAVSATEFEAELLNVDLGAPLMLERRQAFDSDSHPIEYGQDLYRGDRFRFITEFAQKEKML
ncbi:MAG: GntR family transcriptional regulator [Chloroflexi bacterium]|nr:GntR family transcriptional regulator [Chloroflexota bacterium]